MHTPFGRALRKLALVTAAVTAVLTIGATAAFAAIPKALINDSTVSGGAGSEEALIATAQGFAVTVVSDATWAGMTAAQFGTYDLLIAGDPTCGSLPPGLVSSAPVYGPVVRGLAGGRTLAGNRFVIGTDPVFHDGAAGSVREEVVRSGIRFAGKQPGRTGMYFSPTCAANYYGQSAQTLAILAAISSGAGAWTINANPPCGGNVSLIAFEASFAALTTASLQAWGCSVHESFPTFPTDFSALAVATDTASHPTCGVDPNTGLSACGEAYLLISGSSIIVVSGSIAVTPLDATNPAGTTHTVSAHVTAGGAPLAGQVITFTVTGQNAGASGTCVPVGCVTDANGDVAFTYLGANGVGDDTIKASFTDAAGSLQSATAQKHWVVVDRDGDGIFDDVDNCPDTPNPGQADADGDGIGDACDPDRDGDGVPNGDDNCPNTYNPGQLDSDFDGIGDACDGTFTSTPCKVTGGGFITAAKHNFGFNAQYSSSGGAKGNVNYIDKNTGRHLQGADVTGVACSGNDATIRGTGTWNGATVSFTVYVSDNGEPGRADTFRIVLSTGYAAAGTLSAGGNIQIH